MAKDITGINIGVGDSLLVVNLDGNHDPILSAVVVSEVGDNCASVKLLDNINASLWVTRTNLTAFVVCEYDLSLNQYEALMSFRSKL